jgi:hypothetical protein
LSGRDILGVCKNAERRFTSALIRNETDAKEPPMDLYELFISQHLVNLKE